MKIMKIFLLTALLAVASVTSFANTRLYKVWTSDGYERTVEISSPERPVVIKNGSAIIPVYSSNNYLAERAYILVDFIRNGISVTDGNGMAGFLTNVNGQLCLRLDNATIYWSSLVDGAYDVIILPQPR